MLKAKIESRELGLQIRPDGLGKLLFWAPFARTVGVRIAGQGYFQLQPREYGYWQGTLSQVRPGDRYMMVIDERRAIADPASLSQPEGVHKSSAAADPAWFQDRENQWRGIDAAALIIYELHVGTFSPTGDFAGVAERLDYLSELGITALELMPVAAFPGNRNWGYDGVFPFAVHHAYGGAQGLVHLVDACHRRGMAVILDVVYNHLGPEGNVLADAGPYFIDKYRTPWGSAVNFDDAWCDGVRRFFMENALMWLRDFQLDGLRLDAVHAIRDFGPRHFLAELSDLVADLNRQTGRSHFLIGECDLNDVKFITPVKAGGYGLHAQWADEFHHALHAVTTGERQGYYEDFGELSHLARAFNRGYVYSRDYSSHRKKLFGTDTAGQSGERFVAFSQNHDQIGNRMLGERLSTLLDFPTLKLVAGTVFVSPFIPLIFMGEEYGEQAPFLYFTDHRDKALAEAVRAGRKKEFRDFLGRREPPDPQALTTFSECRLKWDFASDRRKACLLAYYKRLVELKKTHPVLRPGERRETRACLSECGRALIWRAQRNGHSLLAIMNFSARALELACGDGIGEEGRTLLYSAHQEWGGAARSLPGPPRAGTSIRLAGKAIILFSGPGSGKGKR